MKTILTDVSVNALQAPAKGQLTVWDKKSPLGVRVSQGGSKTFILMIGSGQRLTIGRVGIVPLAKAREEARRVLAERILGIKPEPLPIKGKDYNSAVAEFVEEHYRDKKPRSKHENNRLLTTRFPTLKRKKLPEITDTDISADLNAMTDTPSEQLHAFRALRVFLKWCLRPPRRFIKHSPLEGYTAPGKDKKGTHILSDIELRKVWRACDELDFFGDIIRLLILWGCRNAEVSRLQRSWREKRVITIPGSHTKNGRAHAVPLLPMAKSILDRIERMGGNWREKDWQYYFPGHIKGTHFNNGSWGKLKKELDKRSGVTGWQVRDLRRTFRSTLARLKVPREIAEVLLNHVTGSGKSDLDEIYDRYDYFDEKKDALAKLERHYARLFGHTEVCCRQPQRNLGHELAKAQPMLD